MRIGMPTIGSTGDVRPYVLLGQELQRRGHEVTVAAFASYEEMVTAAGLRFVPLAGDAMDMMSRIMAPGAVGAGYLKQIEKAIGKIAPVLIRDLVAAFADQDAMVCNFFGSTYYSVAEKWHIPVVQTQFFPMDACGTTPISSAPGRGLGRGWNYASYHLGYLLIHLLEKRYLTAWRQAEGLTVPKVSGRPDYDLLGGEIPVIYAMSEHVMPRPNAWREGIRMSGFWWDEHPKPFAPEQPLVDFLAAGEPPVYVGFGSMVSGDMQHTLETVLTALRVTGLRAVVDTGWAKSRLTPPDNVFVIEGFVPHDWLLPQVRAVVHHGGAGTTAAGLRAGKPTLVVPFGGDQPFWGSRVRAQRCGPAPLPRSRMTVNRLSHALLDLTGTAEYAENAARLGEQLRQEHGLLRAADIIEQELRKAMK